VFFLMVVLYPFSPFPYSQKILKYVLSIVKLSVSSRPQRIILVRHGESEGNINTEIYSQIPDAQVKLTERGRKQSYDAGVKIREITKDESVRFIISPYERSRATYNEIVVGGKFDEVRYSTREDPRIREQDWGNYQNPADVVKSMNERRSFGSFYYRFSNGESGSDVYDRVTTFLSSLNREFENVDQKNIVIVSHGVTLRLFLMRYYQWTIEEFQDVWNFENCHIVMMELSPDKRHYILKSKIRMNPRISSEQGN